MASLVQFRKRRRTVRHHITDNASFSVLIAGREYADGKELGVQLDAFYTARLPELGRRPFVTDRYTMTIDEAKRLRDDLTGMIDAAEKGGRSYKG